jgi:hypothetical protein
LIKELAGAATRLLMLFAGCAALAGLLLYSAKLMPQKADKPTSEVEKIGPSAGRAPNPATPSVAIVATVPKTQAAAAPFVPAPATAQPAATVVLAPTQSVPAPAFAPALPQPDGRADPPADDAAPTQRARTRSVIEVQPNDEEPASAAVAPAPTRQAQTDAPRPARTRSERGSAGCTSYKTYNADTQTYRAFDGRVKPCRP